MFLDIDQARSFEVRVDHKVFYMMPLTMRYRLEYYTSKMPVLLYNVNNSELDQWLGVAS
jgi:hypothetical protein